MLEAEPKEDQAFCYGDRKKNGVKGCQNTRSSDDEGDKTITHNNK